MSHHRARLQSRRTAELKFGRYGFDPLELRHSTLRNPGEHTGAPK